MVQLPDLVKDIINLYLHTLEINGIKITQAILFGSYVSGTNDDYSDIDIALVSDSFVGNRITDKDKIRAITLSISSAIDVIPFSIENFNKKDPFINEILKHGINLI